MIGTALAPQNRTKSLSAQLLYLYGQPPCSELLLQG